MESEQTTASDRRPCPKCGRSDQLRITQVIICPKRFAANCKCGQWAEYADTVEGAREKWNVGRFEPIEAPAQQSKPLLGLSLTQPWASLVAFSLKEFETRSWQHRYTGELAIHAAKGFPRECAELCFEEPFASALAAHRITQPGDLPRGAIIALCRKDACEPTVDVAKRISDCELAFGDYSPGRFAWPLRESRALSIPIACKGALQLWRVPQDVEAQIRGQLR